MKINELYRKNEYKSFVEFCDECSIEKVEYLRQADFVLFQKISHCDDALKFDLMNIQKTGVEDISLQLIKKSENLPISNYKIFEKKSEATNDNEEIVDIKKLYFEGRQKELLDESNYLTLFGEKIFLEDTDEDGCFVDHINLIELTHLESHEEKDVLMPNNVVESCSYKYREFFNIIVEANEKFQIIKVRAVKFDLTTMLVKIFENCSYFMDRVVDGERFSSIGDFSHVFQNCEKDIFIEHAMFEKGVTDLRNYIVEIIMLESDMSTNFSMCFVGFNEDLVAEFYCILQQCFSKVLAKANAYYSLDRLAYFLKPHMEKIGSAHICHLVAASERKEIEEISKRNSLTRLNDIFKISFWETDTSSAFNLEKAIVESFNKLLLPKNSLKRCLQLLSPRGEIVLRRRYFNDVKCKTLEEVGKIYSVTRERIRQIEAAAINIMSSKKGISRINNLIKSIMCFSNSKYYTTYEELSKFGINIMFMMFLESVLGRKIFVDGINILVFSNYDWIELLEKYAEAIPDTVEVESVEKYVQGAAKMLNEQNFIIDFERVKNIIFNLYTENGVVFSKTKLSLVEKYKIVLEKYFANGISVYDDFELDKFRNSYKKVFSDDAVADNNRALVGRITDNCLVIARGRYGLKKEKYISDELLDKLYLFIKSSYRDIVMTNTIFNEFEEELQKEGVENKYYLQAIIRQYYENEFFFTRDYISKTKEKSTIYKDIISYIEDRQEVVNMSEIKSEFPGVPDIVISIAFTDKHIIGLWNKNYIHSSVLNILEADVDSLGEIIDRLVDEKSIIDSDKLFQEICIQNSEFIKKNNVDSHFMMYSIVQFMFDGEYEFKRPFIANIGTTIEGRKERISAYVEQFDELEIVTLQEYIDEQGIHIYSMFELLKELDEYFRIDNITLKKESLIEITEDNIQAIENVLSFLFEKNGYISSAIINYYLLPIISLKWNCWLLQSVVEKHLENIATVFTTNFFNNTIPIFVASELDINNYEELIEYAIKRENNIEKFLTLPELKKWLLEKGLISKGIPGFVFSKNIVEIDENERITIY